MEKCLLPSYQIYVSALMAIFRLTKTHIRSYIWHASVLLRMGAALLDGGMIPVRIG